MAVFFSAARSTGLRDYICYVANEGRQHNGKREVGAPARVDPAAWTHTQHAERLVQPSRGEDACLLVDYTVQLESFLHAHLNLSLRRIILFYHNSHRLRKRGRVFKTPVDPSVF